MQVKSELLFCPIIRSPMWPPQPTVEPSGEADCQKDAWSLWENSLGGKGYLLRSGLLTCARVSGTTSGPTFSCTATAPSALYRLASCDMAGCSAYWRPLASGVLGFSTVPDNADCASAMPPAVRPAPPPRMAL